MVILDDDADDAGEGEGENGEGETESDVWVHRRKMRRPLRDLRDRIQPRNEVLGEGARRWLGQQACRYAGCKKRSTTRCSRGLEFGVVGVEKEKREGKRKMEVEGGSSAPKSGRTGAGAGIRGEE